MKKQPLNENDSSTRVPAAPKRYSVVNVGSKRIWVAWFILAAGISMSVISAMYVKNNVEESAEKEFTYNCNDLQYRLSTRLRLHAQILRSSAAFFEGSDEVTRDEWHKSVAIQEIDNNLPGIEGIGYALIVPAAMRTAHEKKVRAEGFSAYAVTPAGERDVVSSVIYIEPFTEQSRRLFGYDLLTDSICRDAMRYAAEMNAASLSGTVRISADEKNWKGVLLFTPVYEKGRSLTTVEDRRKALSGWVFIPYRLNDVMKGLSGGWEENEKGLIRVQIFDHPSLLPESILYDSNPRMGEPLRSGFMTTETIDFNNRRWFLRIAESASINSALDYSSVWVVAFSGTAISLLLFILYVTLLNINYQAHRKAKELTKELQESTEQLQFALVGAHDGVWDVQMETGSVYISPRGCEILGYAPDALQKTSATWNDLVHPDDLEETKEALRAYNEGRSPLFMVEQRLKTATGSWKWILTRGKAVSFDADGKPLRMVGTHSDISERKRAEQALRKSEELYRRLFQNMLNGFAYCRMLYENEQPVDFQYLSVNGAFESLTGLKNVVGRRISELVPDMKERDPELFTIYSRVALHGVPERFEIYLESMRMWFAVSVYSPEREYFVAVFDVITERKVAEQQIKKINETLEQKVTERTAQLEFANKELESFSYSVAHDLRSPLQVIDGFSRILMDNYAPQLDAEAVRKLGVIRKSADKMNGLISGLLSLSRSSRVELQKTRFDTVAMVREQYGDLSLNGNRDAIQFVLPDLPASFGDPRLIAQVWTNLLSNAVKYSKGKYPIVIHVGGSEQNGMTTFFVKDNGVGFDPQYAQTLFGVFKRLHSAEHYEGTGIGLAIAQRIITRHGGSIWAESTPGEGATFYFTLPRMPEA